MLTDLLLILTAFLIAAVLRQWAVEPVHVRGASMRPTLENGEVLLVTKADYLLHPPRRGDVVICHYPGRYTNGWKLFPQYFVKRIVGLPGETLEIVEGVVHIDGTPLQEPYVDAAHNRIAASHAPVTLGSDEYFVMGDNRDNSNDSRRIGPLKRSMIVGRVRQVMFPFTRFRPVR